MALLKAYRWARDVAFNQIYGTDSDIVIYSWAAARDKQRADMGENYWPNDIKDNVPSLEAMVTFSLQLGITPGKLDYESFLHPEAALPGS